MPGWGRRAAQDVIAETGADMTRFAAPGHLASWAGGTPLDHQSGKRAGPGRRKHGNRCIGAVTGETSAAARKTQTREGARYRRLSRRKGKAKALVAVGNTQMRTYHVLLSNPGMRYQGLGADYYERDREHRPPGQPPHRQTRRPRLRSHPLPARRTRGPQAPRPPDPRPKPSRRHKPPPAPAACPRTLQFSGQCSQAAYERHQAMCRDGLTVPTGGRRREPGWPRGASLASVAGMARTRSTGTQLIAVIAALHRVDYRAAGLGSSRGGVATPSGGSGAGAASGRSSPPTNCAPLGERAGTLLAGERAGSEPTTRSCTATSASTTLWSIWIHPNRSAGGLAETPRVAAVLDWEFATIGDPTRRCGHDVCLSARGVRSDRRRA